MRKTISTLNKIAVVILVMLALIFFSFSEGDECASWAISLMYFTGQSNLWIFLVFLTLLIFTLLFRFGKVKIIPKFLYVLKFVATVCIAMTFSVFVFLIAPFAGNMYTPWSAYSVITHLLVPIIAIVDFYLDDYQIKYSNKHVLLSLIPPVVYFSIASILCVLRVDFGRGQAFPYFFMNFYSEAGVFGFKWGSPPLIGSIYWFILLTVWFTGLAFLLRLTHPKTKSYRKQHKSS